MTYYQQQVIKMREAHFPRQYVIDRLAAARRLMEEDYMAGIDMAMLSRKSLLSKYHFIRLFKKCYGRTPHQYLTEIKIRHAKSLLQKQLPVNDTCFCLGFESPTSFSALFKKYTGLTPSAYREKAILNS